MRRTKEEWAEIVESYQASELTVRQFCQAENVSEQSLRNWNKRLVAGNESTPNVEHGFVEVRSIIDTGWQESCEEKSRDPSCQRTGLIIRFHDDTVIEVQPDTDRATLAWVLALMVNR